MHDLAAAMDAEGEKDTSDPAMNSKPALQSSSADCTDVKVSWQKLRCYTCRASVLRRRVGIAVAVGLAS